jgi:hypothetical protein
MSAHPAAVGKRLGASEGDATSMCASGSTWKEKTGTVPG